MMNLLYFLELSQLISISKESFAGLIEDEGLNFDTFIEISKNSYISKKL